MSHTTTISSVQIKDEAAIVKAVQNLRNKGVGIELMRNTTARMYFERQTSELGVCDYVLKLPGSPYDVGLKKNKDNVFIPYFDEWQGQVGKHIGAACAMPSTPEERAMHAIGQFSQEYAKEAAINAATAQGYYVESADVNEKGEVELVFVGM